jgi:hypothetical protein
MSGRKIIVAMTVGALWTSAALLAAGRPSKGQALGYVTSQGEVRVDRQAAPSGTSVFAGDVITTGSGAVASVKLVWGAQATLGENGEMRVGSGDSAAEARARGHGAAPRRQRSRAYRGRGVHHRAGGRAGLPGDLPGGLRGRRDPYLRRSRACRSPSQGILPAGLRLEAGMPQAAGQVAAKSPTPFRRTVQHPGRPIS